MHHILVHYLEQIWEPVFIHDSYACRYGKGTHKAVVRLQKFLRQITRNGNLRAYYLQLDIKDFFINIDKQVLFELIRKRVSDPDVLWLAETVLFWDCTRAYVAKGDRRTLASVPSNKTLFGKNNLKGLPIGNLTSQFFANIYLNELDQFIKHGLKARFYIRYVDDFILLHKDAAQLRKWQGEIERFLVSQLKLQLHPKRRKLQPVSSGIDFLGYVARHNYILVRRRVVNNLEAKLRRFCAAKNKDFGQLQATLFSYLGHFKWANTYKLRNKFVSEVSQYAEHQN